MEYLYSTIRQMISLLKLMNMCYLNISKWRVHCTQIVLNYSNHVELGVVDPSKVKSV